MKKMMKITVAALVGLLVLTGCKADRTREEKAAAIIGKIESPFLVISTTPQNLMDKSGVQDGVLPFTYELILDFFIDEAVTGIDYSVKTQLVVAKGESFQPSFYGIFKIKDEAKFKELIEKEANATIVEKEGMKTAVKEKDGYAVVWNEEFAIISNIPIDFSAMFTGGSGGANGDKVVNKLIGLINAAEEEEVNTTYADFLKKDADIAMYYDGKGFYAYMKEMMMDEQEEVEKMRATYEGLTSEIYLNFNDGAVDFEFINHMSDELKTELSFIRDKGITGKLLGYANSPNPIMVGGYNLDLAKFFDYVESSLEEDAYNEMEEDMLAMGLTVDEFKSCMSGELIYLIDRVVSVEETVDYGYGEPYTYTAQTPMFALVAGVSNPSVIQKLLADSLKMPNGAYHMGDAYVVLDGDVLFASNDSAWAGKVIAKSTTTVSKGTDLIAANPFAMFVDFTSLSQMGGMEDAAAFLSIFTEFSGGAKLDGGTFTLKLKDASQNSLRVITQAVADELARQEKEMNAEMDAELEDAVLEGLEELDSSLKVLEEELP
jgi:hypothetical protein